MNSGLLFAYYAYAWKTAVLNESFSNPFSDFPIEGYEGNPNNSYLSVKIRNPDFKVYIQISLSNSNSLTYEPRNWAKSNTFTCKLSDCISHADWLFTVTRRCGNVYLGVVALSVCEVCYVYMRDMWVVQWYCIFEMLVATCEVIGVEVY